MKLLELTIRNFKGIDYFHFSPQGKNANVYGENGTGKTTIPDAFRWLLFGKDTKDQKDSGRSPFIIKPIGSNGNEATEHEVYAKLEHQDRIIELKRIHKEVFNKNGDLTGSTTRYYLNDVPDIKEKDYKEFIQSLIDEKKSKMLIDPFYFSEKQPWQERRSILFEMFGNKTDQEIIDSNKELSEINGFLNGHMIDDCKKIIKDKRKKIKEAKDEIPIRKDEANNKIIEGIDESKEDGIKKEIETTKEKLKALQEKKMIVENDKGTIDKKAELTEIRQRISKFIQDYENNIDNEIYIKNKILKQAEEKYEDACNLEDRQEKALKAIENEAIDIEEKLLKLRDQWEEENKKEFQVEINNVCPACGQTLPEEKIQITQTIALEKFNKEKAELLESIQKKGQSLKAVLESLQKDKAGLEKQIKDSKAEKENLNKKAQAIEKQIENIREKKDKYTREKEFLDLAKKEIELMGQLERLMSGDKKAEIEKIETKIQDEEKALDTLKNDLFKIGQNKEHRSRIEELKEEGKRLSNEEIKLKGQLALLDEFTRTKVEMIEGPINDSFRLAKFKLFNRLVNGEIEDCCEVTDKKDVPFVSNLNKGAQINIGLDIINNLSGHYGFCAPIFIDNAEASTKIFDTKNQKICLYVTSLVDSIKSMIEEFEELKTEFNIEFVNEDLLQTDHQIEEIIERYKEYKKMEEISSVISKKKEK